MNTKSIVLILVVIVAIIAGFVLFNTSYSGAAISTTYGGTYWSPSRGIVQPYPVGQDVEYPAVPEIQLLSTRFPAFVLLGNTNFAEIGKCRVDLIWKANIANAGDRFLCFTIPVDDITTRPPIDPWKSAGPRGDVFCYARTTGAEGQGIDSEKAVRDKILQVLVNRPDNYPWSSINIVNAYGQRQLTPVCGTQR